MEKKMIKFFTKQAKAEWKNGISGTTYWYTLDIINDKEYAVVMGWNDGFAEDKPTLCMKLAFLPTNSLMSEYDIDWLMPYDEQGEVDDTEMSIESEDDIIKAVEYMVDVFKTRYAE